MGDAEVAAWEGIAREILEETGVGLEAPVDALELAELCGLDVRPRRGRERLEGDVVHVDVRARPERQQGTVAHELGHWALARAREDDSEQAASYVGGALLVPRLVLDRQLRGTWRLEDLRRAHPNASHELLARRVSELRDAVVTVLDHGRVKRRVASPWLPAPSQGLSALERALVDAAYATGRVARLESTQAVPVFEGRWRRVVVIAPRGA